MLVAILSYVMAKPQLDVLPKPSRQDADCGTTAFHETAMANHDALTEGESYTAIAATLRVSVGLLEAYSCHC